jgi:hypothetical protein
MPNKLGGPSQQIGRANSSLMDMMGWDKLPPNLLGWRAKPLVKPEAPNIGRTMRAAHAAAVDEPDRAIVKPGELIDVRFSRDVSPSLWTRKTIALLIAKAAGEAWRDHVFEISKAELRQGHESNDRIPDLLTNLAAIQLQSMTITTYGTPARSYFGLFEWIEEETDDGDKSRVWFKFNERARKIFGASDVFARLNKAAILAFQSKYAVTLYEMGALVCARRDPVWRGTVTDLRAVLGVPPDKYRDWTNIRQRVIEPALTEINHLAHFTATIQEKRQGRKVVSVVLNFAMKSEAAISAAAKELDRPKVGRKARRIDTVERIADDLAVAEAKLRALPLPRSRH